MNVSVLKMVVMIIGAVLILSVVGIVYLVTQDRNIPSTLETITVGGMLGLLGLLAPSKDAQNPNN